jgi:hypothetical protein
MTPPLPRPGTTPSDAGIVALPIEPNSPPVPEHAAVIAARKDIEVVQALTDLHKDIASGDWQQFDHTLGRLDDRQLAALFLPADATDHDAPDPLSVDETRLAIKMLSPNSADRVSDGYHRANAALVDDYRGEHTTNDASGLHSLAVSVGQVGGATLAKAFCRIPRCDLAGGALGAGLVETGWQLFSSEPMNGTRITAAALGGLAGTAAGLKVSDGWKLPVQVFTGDITSSFIEFAAGRIRASAHGLPSLEKTPVGPGF